MNRDKILCSLLISHSICLSLFCTKPTSSDYYDYLRATFAQRGGNIEIAQKCYDHLLNKSQSTYAYQGYLKHLFTSDQYQTIVQLAPTLEKNFKQDLDAQLIFAQAFEITGNTQAAEDRFILLGKQFPTHSEAAYYAAAALTRRGQYNEALATISNYLDSSIKKPINFLFYFLQAQTYQQLKDPKRALASIETCVAMAPEFYQGWLFFGIMHEMVGNLNQAISGYQNYLGIVGNDLAVQRQLVSLILKKQQQGAQPQDKYTIRQAMTLFEQRHYEPALALVNEYLEHQPQHIPSKLLKIDVLCALNRSRHAIELIKQWILESPQDDIWFKTLHTLYEAQHHQNQIATLFEELAQKLPSNPLAHLYCADIHLRSKEPKQALTHLHNALSYLSDPQIKTITLYQMAVLHYEQKNYKAMKPLLEDARLLGQRFTPLLNLYAYYCATKGHDLEFAQKLYDSIIDTDKTNPHIQQTQTVIWYKQREHKRAHNLLSALIKIMPDDYYVEKYYAKNLFKLNKKQEAITALKAAVIHAPHDYDKQKCKQLINSWQTCA